MCLVCGAIVGQWSFCPLLGPGAWPLLYPLHRLLRHDVFNPTARSARRIQKPFDRDLNSRINSSFQHSQRVAVRREVINYRRECDHHKAVLVPGLLTTGGLPRTPNYPTSKDAIAALFRRGTVTMRGSLGISTEDGLTRSIAVDAIRDDMTTITALYDQTFARSRL